VPKYQLTYLKEGNDQQIKSIQTLQAKKKLFQEDARKMNNCGRRTIHSTRGQKCRRFCKNHKSQQLRNI
jgi:hypothetical protein